MLIPNFLKPAAFIFAIWCFLLLTLCPSVLLAANTQEPSRPLVTSAAEFDYPPFSIVSDTGTATGFSVELLKAALDVMGYDVTFNVGPWTEVKQSLIDRRVQVLPLVGRTPEREALFDFTFPYFSMHGTIIVRNDEQDIHGLSDLKGRTVATLKGDNAEEFLHRSNLGANIVARDSFESALLELSQGQYDAVIIQKLLATQLIQKNSIENLRSVGPPLKEFVQSFCFAVPKGNAKLLKILNEGLSIVIANRTFEALRAKWFASLETLPKSRIIVGGDKDFPPYEYLDENGQPTGFIVELTRAIAKQLNLQVDIKLDRWDKVQEGLNATSIDLVEGMFYSVERDKLFDFSASYTQVGYSIVTRQGEPTPKSLQELKGKLILVMSGDIMHDLAVQNGYEKQLIPVSSQEEALRLLAEGEDDCALVARIPALQWIEKYGWNNLVVGSESILSPELSYAAPHGNEALLAKFSDGLVALKNSGEYRKIYSKWFSIYENDGLNARDILKYALLGIAPFLLLLGGSAYWNKTLNKKIKIKTSELVKEIGERKQAEERLIQNHDLLSKLARLVPGVIYQYRLFPDGSSAFPFASPGMNDIYEVAPEEVQEDATPVFGRLHPDDYDRVANLIQDSARTLKPFYCEFRVILPRQGLCWRWSQAHPERLDDGSTLWHGIISDITERKQSEHEKEQLQDQLHQTQKIESIGQLAGGVAHDFNNMLGVILGHAELALMKIDPTDPFVSDFEEIRAAARRSADLTRQLLTFARKQNVVPKVLNLNDTVAGMLKMLQRLIGENIHLSWNPKPKLWAVKIDPSQLDQILANLCVNARDAIGSIGKITIETENCSFCESDLKNHPEARPGDYVRLSVSDDGRGIDKDTLLQIFEPFFTTKEFGEGTGLGLSTVFGAVKQNQGFIEVDSKLEQGTTFYIYLPRQQTSVKSVEGTTAKPLHKGTETILLVEDDQMLLTLVKAMLQKSDYTVLDAATIDQAISLAKEHPGPIHLLLSDLIMPEMNGKDLRDILQVIRTEMRVIFMSGYTADIIAKQGVVEEGVHFLPKPVSFEALTTKVREVLDAAP